MSNADSRGWGPGWPNCQRDRIQRVNIRGVTYPGGVRAELVELVTRLTGETMDRGYVFGVPGDINYGMWGFDCRPIRGSQNPSNHSWGLAVDINAPRNPMGAPLRTDMPGWMIALWESYGFRWGGRFSRPDAMHYEFMGTPQQAASFTDLARRNRIGDGTAPAPEEDDMYSDTDRARDMASNAEPVLLWGDQIQYYEVDRAGAIVSWVYPRGGAAWARIEVAPAGTAEPLSVVRTAIYDIGNGIMQPQLFVKAPDGVTVHCWYDGNWQRQRFE